MAVRDHAAGGDSRRARRQLSERMLERVCERLRVVAEPTRVRIMLHLERYGDATVQDVCDGLLASHQNVSKHLRTLYAAGLVTRRREGTSVRYELADYTALWTVEKTIASLSAQREDEQEQLADV